MTDRKLRPESLMMSYGYKPELSQGAVKCPIFQTSTFVFQKAEDGKAFFEVAYGLREQGEKEELGLIYSRLNNPDLEILEDRLGLWENAGERLARPIIFMAQRGLITEEEWTAWFARFPTGGDEIFASQAGLARRHDVNAFLQVIWLNARLSESAADDVLLPGAEAAMRAMP